MPHFQVCQGASCGGNGAIFAIRDIEDLSWGLATIETTGCLGHCGKGPNSATMDAPGGRGKVTNKLAKFGKIVDYVTEGIPGFALNETQKKVNKLKYNCRRDDNADERKKLLEEALTAIESDEKAAGQNPELKAQVLLMRARETFKADKQSALRDAMAAVEILPSWAYGHVTLSQVQEFMSMPHQALASLKKGIELKWGIDAASLKRTLTRLEKRAAETPEPTEDELKAMLGDPAGAASGSAEGQKPKAKSKAKAKSTAKKDSDKAKSASSSSSSSKTKKKDEAKPKVVELEEHGEMEDWTISAVKQENHDCIRMELSCNKAPKNFQCESWHVDLIADIGDLHEEVRRSYTPVSTAAEIQKGFLDLMVKVYPDGKLTSHLKTLKVGDTLSVTTPHPTLETADYAAGLVMVAAGSAVTVGLQVCAAVLAKAAVPVHLFLCNKTAEDVLFQDRFEAMLAAHPTFSVTHCLSQGAPPESASSQKAKWQQGRLSQDLIAAAPQDLKAVISGPRGLCRTAYDAFLKTGRTEDQINCLDELPEAEAQPEETPVTMTEDKAQPEADSTAVASSDQAVPVVEKAVRKEPQGFFERLFFGCSRGCQSDEFEASAEDAGDEIARTS
eukprot:TRINITY_DN102896_c0_g1_i1.p1 TRINITY_DN102896_c0_g1~~TRINITY_DN102896_c0_g1_i1.p1  ORF type:complete len:616 (-),score=149.63 TRINITY_DN102896_c0_g1_i1:38-1885(-)